jgi:hypothetical protein
MNEIQKENDDFKKIDNEQLSVLSIKKMPIKASENPYLSIESEISSSDSISLFSSKMEL